MSRTTQLILPALDGANPLGFFAAIGVLTAVTTTHPQAKMAWIHSGGWRPVLAGVCSDFDTLTQLLDSDRRECVSDVMLCFEYDGKRDLKPRPEVFSALLTKLVQQAGPRTRRSVDWASSFATDVAVDNNGNAKPTAFHFTAGQQQFLQMATELVEQVSAADLREAVEGPWHYDRPLPVLGWDATSSRDYALRAGNPSLEKKLGVPGADWLALRGVHAFPIVARGERLVTTGCSGGWKDSVFRWPLWSTPIPLEVVRSLVSIDTWNADRHERQARGIAAVYASRIRRSDQGGYGSFEPPLVI